MDIDKMTKEAPQASHEDNITPYTPTIPKNVDPDQEVNLYDIMFS